MTRESVDKLFETISPRMGDRNGGYLRILQPDGKGDGADLAVIELLGSEQVIAEKQQKRAEARAKRAEEAKPMEEAEAQREVEHAADHAEGGEQGKRKRKSNKRVKSQKLEVKEI